MARRTRLLDRRPPSPVEPARVAVEPPPVLWLSEPLAVDASVAGAKAAALARATLVGLPVLPGVVLTTAGTSSVEDAVPSLREAWNQLSDHGAIPLAVRSSSTIEDGNTSSMAGMFTSILDVEGWSALLQAIGAVLRSAGDAPMAVLLQPMLDASVGGVLFGVDPVSGRTDRLLVESVEGGPAPLVSGLVSGARHLLTRRGRLLESDDRRGPRSLDRAARRALASTARATARAFGAPQDVEWAFDRNGELWVLQSRPITAVAAVPPASGPILGPGPIAETFPDALSPLEQDLWVGPMRSGITDALAIVGVAPRRARQSSPVLVVIGGRVAADLELLGGAGPASFLARFDPRPPARRLVASWRVGRLRVAMPLIAGDLITRLDADLERVPELSSLDESALLDVLHATRRSLHAVHGHEVLAGILGTHGGASAAGLALGALTRGRAAGLSNADIIAAEPVVLALTTPGIGARPSLPDIPAAWIEGISLGDLGPREALRLRARWLHELSARAAVALGGRLGLGDPTLVRWLRLDELTAAVAGGPLPSDLMGRAESGDSPPLPTAFRLAGDGTAVATPPRRGRRLEGRGAGGGRAVGRVHDVRSGPPRAGDVLVVKALEPGLAGMLPGLGAIIAETGSVLSHLAILARELGIPTVVGVADAVERFPAGTTVVVDGATGEVTALEAEGRA